MTVIYKILSVIINLVGLLMGVSLIFILPLALAAPPLWLPTFLLVAIVLYTVFSSRFRNRVLQRQEVVKYNLRDWIRVNGFVAIAFSILNIPTTISILANPMRFAGAMKEMLKQFGDKYEQGFNANNLSTIAAIMLVYFIALLIHVLWTFALMKKYQEFFKKD